MAGELEFGALHSDDKILDALAARAAVESDDMVVNLLAALAADVDSRPVPIADAWAAGLLSRPVAAARTETAAVSAGAQSAVAAGVGAAEVLGRPAGATAAATTSGAVSAPPLTPLPARRRARMLMLPRAAATAGIASLVLGVGGVAAAVGGGSPLDGIRRVVGNVIEPVAPAPSREDRVSRLLDQAATALESADTQHAATLLTQASTQLGGLHGPKAGPLTQKFEALEARLEELLAARGQVLPAGGALGTLPVPQTNRGSQPDAISTPSAPGVEAPGVVPGPTAYPLGESPKDATQSPHTARSDGLTQNLPGPDLGNPTDHLPGSGSSLPGETKIGDAEKTVTDKAKTIPKPLPDDVDTPVGPVHPWRSPSSIDVLDDPTVHHVVLGTAPAAGELANGVTGGGGQP